MGTSLGNGVPFSVPHITFFLLRAARVIRPRILFPYHYGQTDVTTLPDLLKADGIDVRIRHYE